MERLRCVVERITYSNEENGYIVLRARARGFAELVTVVGKLAAVNVGSVLTLSGEWTLNSKYGRQFAVAAWEETLPATIPAIEKYLGSGMIKGIGPKYARRIVEKFGVDTLTVIEDAPDRLNEIDGIGSKRVGLIKKAWQEQKEIKEIMLFLQSHNVSASLAVKIFKTYGNESIAVVRENPYRLADDIWGIGFRTADIIAQKLGMDRESFHRCRSGLLYALNEFSNDGHCYAPREALTEQASRMLEIDAAKLVMTLDEMRTKKDIIWENGERIYLPSLFFSEIGVARRLRAIMSAPAKLGGADVDAVIARAERSSGMEYDEVQRAAIRSAVESKVMILTGGPGTGKTTTTKGIIAAFAARGLTVLLAAPTGRAAKRLSESSGLEAKTIHRLLESKPPEGYGRNAENPLEGGVLIVDESSMVDVTLMYNLLKAVPDEMTLIFVGDCDQLPSVGAGNVLTDMINSGEIPVVRLTRIYRQAQGSRIIMNAHRVNRGKFPDLSGGRDSDFFFIEAADPNRIPALISDLCSRRLPRYYGIDPRQSVQVLTPMQRGETGAVSLNAVLQNALNPSQLCLRRGGAEFRLGDKVMQLRNNYDKGVFNGDVGIISAVDTEERELTVTFDGAAVIYDVSELDELTLAYAATIHKSQGSEYPIVVMPFTMQHYVMLQKNLLYTGITRAKRALVIVGTKKALGYAIGNNRAVERNTMLAERLSSA